MAVADQPGAVFSVDADRAIYVGREEIEAYAGLAEAFLRVPTVAGPPLDLAALGRLHEKLDAARTTSPAAGHPLDPDEARCLELLYEQSALRAVLPLRLHRTCTACGRQKIINPARPKATAAEKAGDVANAIVGFAKLADDPLGGFLEIMGAKGSKHTVAVLCDYCEGFEFDFPAVTFCPACKALRTESVLVTCPDCQAEFGSAGGNGGKPVWAKLADVRDVARLTELRRTVDAACARLAGVYAEQQKALLEGLAAADEPRCLFRSSRPGDPTRSTVLMATSRQLAFVKETMVGKASADQVAWADVAAIRHFIPAKAGRDVTIQVEPAVGPPLQFTRVNEAGQNLHEPGTLDPTALAHLLAELAGVPLQGPPDAVVPAQPGPAPQPVPGAQVVPGQVAPEPVAVAAALPAPTAPASAAVPAGPPRPPSEQPGWYPDPWGQSRIRWWDGTAWTGHLSA